MKSRREGVGGAAGVTILMTAAAAMLMVTIMGEVAAVQNSTKPVPAIRNMSYPLLDGVPITDFRCNDRPAGYYADPEAGCQLYHMCDTLGKQYSYLCPNYTLFNQKVMVCDHWYMVNCSTAPEFYDLNSHIGKIPLQPPVVENGIDLDPTVSSSITPAGATLTFAGLKGNTAAKRSGLPSLSPSSASSSPSSPPPAHSSLSFFKSSPFSLTASTSTPSSPSPTLTPPRFSPSLAPPRFSPSSPFSTSVSPSNTSSSSSSSIPSTPPPPTSPLTRPSTLLKPLNTIVMAPLSPLSSSFSPHSFTTTASSPPSSLLQRATTPATRPAFPPSLPTSPPLSSPLNLSTLTPTRSTFLTPLSSNSSSFPSSSSPSSTLPSLPSSSSSFVSPSSPRPFSVPENLDSPSLLARGKGQDRPVFGVLSTTTSSPSPTKPSLPPHLQSVAFALKPQKPNKNDMRGVILHPVLIRLNENDGSNEISPTVMPPAETTVSSAVTDTPVIPSMGNLVPQTESAPLTTSLPEKANLLPMHFMLNTLLQPPLHPFESAVRPPSQFLRPPTLLQSTRPHLSFPSGRVPDKNALSTDQKQESLTFLFPSSLSTKRGPQLLPNTTSFRFTSFRPNRDFFIPTANFPMPPLEEDHLHEGLVLRKVLSAELVSHNGVEDPSKDDHPHMFHMTMVFPVMMGAQRFGSLQLNPECPHCHPVFLKPNQCHPCVIIK